MHADTLPGTYSHIQYSHGHAEWRNTHSHKGYPIHQTHTHIHIYSDSTLNTHTHAYPYVHKHILQVRTHIHTCTQTHAYTHPHTQARHGLSGNKALSVAGTPSLSEGVCHLEQQGRGASVRSRKPGASRNILVKYPFGKRLGEFESFPFCDFRPSNL